MILDWAKQCKKIHETKVLSTEDPADNKKRFMQEIVYLCYLKNVLGKTESECFALWKEIQNGVAKIFSDDEEQLMIEFNSLYKKTEEPKYKNINCAKELKPIKIYRPEIEFLNSLNAPVWVKQYWLCLLTYYKFDVQIHRRVQKTKTLNAWAIRQTSFKSKNYGGDCQDTIAQYKLQNNTVKIIDDIQRGISEAYPVYKPDFIHYKGKVMYTCDDINDIQNILPLIKNNVRYCEKCGREFVVSTKTKRKICEKCYKNYRKNRILEYLETQKAIE